MTLIDVMALVDVEDDDGELKVEMLHWWLIQHNTAHSIKQIA